MILDDFPLRTFDKIRYADTDKQGHVNNAIFSTFLETGRAELLYNKTNPLAKTNAEFVIAHLAIEFMHEILWPGEVQIGTRVLKIGSSSVHLFQRIAQGNTICAEANTCIVQIDQQTRKSLPLSDSSKIILKSYMITS